LVKFSDESLTCTCQIDDIFCPHALAVLCYTGEINPEFFHDSVIGKYLLSLQKAFKVIEFDEQISDEIILITERLRRK